MLRISTPIEGHRADERKREEAVSLLHASMQLRRPRSQIDREKLDIIHMRYSFLDERDTGLICMLLRVFCRS